MRVSLGGRQPRMSQQLLNRAKIRASLQQVGGKGVPERVGADALLKRRLTHVLSDDPVHAARGQTSAAKVEKQSMAPARVW